MNKTILIGNVGSKSEVRKSKKGTSIINLTLATEERYKDKDGSLKKLTDWHNLTFFAKLADVVDKYIEVGATICVEGSSHTEKYEKDGITRYNTHISVEKMEMLSSKKSKKEQPATPPQPKPGDKCPKCDTGTMQLKTGTKGEFLACDQYPTCKSTLPYKGSEK